MTPDDLRAAVSSNLPLYLRWLDELTAIPSVAGDDSSLDRAAEWIAELIGTELGGEAEIVETAGRPVVFGRIPGQGDQTLLCYNHYDVQPPEPLELWRGDPFRLRTDDGRLVGRGVADNKGQLLSRLAAAHLCQRLGGLGLSLELFVEGEEEAGSPNVAPAVRSRRDWFQAGSCLWESGYKNERGQYCIGLGAKGILYLDITVRGAGTDLHSVWGGMAPNPLWELVWALGSLKGRDGELLVPGLTEAVREPDRGELAILEAMDFPEGERLEQWGLGRFVHGLRGTGLQVNQRFRPQVNICGISGGYAGPGMKTVIPSVATAKVDIRLVPFQDPDRVLEAVREHLQGLGLNLEVRVLGSEPPAYTPVDSPLVRAMIGTCEEFSGYRPPILLGGEGSGPMHAFTDTLGIPVANGFGVGNASSWPHAPEENIRVEDFVDGTALLVRLFQTLGG